MASARHQDRASHIEKYEMPMALQMLLISERHVCAVCEFPQVFLSLREKLKAVLLDTLKSCLQRKQAERALVLWEVFRR